MPKPSVKNLLNDIKSEEIVRAYINVTNKAVEWAVAGFMDEANKLLEKLWSYGTPHSGDLWVPDQGLLVMWHLAGKKPQNIPFAGQDISHIEKANYSGLFLTDLAKQHPPELSADPLTGSLDGLKDYLLSAEQWLAEQTQHADVKKLLEDYENELSSARAAGYGYFHPVTCAAILAARNGDIKRAEYFIRLWGEGYNTYRNNYTLAYLMRDTATAKILLTGILAPVFALTAEICDREYEAISQALDDRYATGRSLVYSSFTWKQLLEKTSVLAIEQLSNDFDEEMIESKWLGNHPAPEDDIEAAEKRLGIQLPEDYKQFLLASNGFASISSTDVFLVQVEEIQRFGDFDPDTVEGWSESNIEFDPAYGDPFKNSIIIGGLEDEQQLLLVPVNDGVWECWFFAFWMPGEHKFPSFRYYMEDRLQRLEDNFYAQ